MQLGIFYALQYERVQSSYFGCKFIRPQIVLVAGWFVLCLSFRPGEEKPRPSTGASLKDVGCSCVPPPLLFVSDLLRTRRVQQRRGGTPHEVEASARWGRRGAEFFRSFRQRIHVA